MKKTIINILLLSLVVLFTTGCGERVRVEQNEVAKVLSTNGLEDTVRTNSTFRLESCIFSACPKLVKLDITKNTKTMNSQYFMPKSDMELGLELTIQYSPKVDKKSINSIYKDIRAEDVPNSSFLAIIDSEKLYEIYIQPILKDTTRQALNDYKIEQIMDNLEDSRKFVFNMIKEKLKETPIHLDSLSFSKISYPSLILQKKKEFAAIDTQKATDMKSMAAELEIMAKKLELEKKKAKMQLEVDKIISKRLDENMVIWGIVQAAQTSAENGTPWSLGGGTFNMLNLKDMKKKLIEKNKE